MTNTKNKIVDLSRIYFDFQEEYRNVFLAQIEDEVFIYRSLGRGEFRNVMIDEDLNDFQKQDVICELCTLYPENYDFDSCPAGLPDELYSVIIKNSFLDSNKSKKAVLTHYRKEMFDLENQITCVINEAFPQFDVEEIEQWDVEQTMKYMSRAEWKLINLRGLEMNQSAALYEDEASESVEEAQEPSSPPQEPSRDKDKTIRGDNKGQKMSPEKLEEMRRMQEKFPEINFFGDTILNEGEEGMKDSFDDTPPALRPGF